MIHPTFQMLAPAFLSTQACCRREQQTEKYSITPNQTIITLELRVLIQIETQSKN